jgi:hypothetical protein
MKHRRQWPRYNDRQSAQSGVVAAKGVGNGERSLRHGALTYPRTRAGRKGAGPHVQHHDTRPCRGAALTSSHMWDADLGALRRRVIR